jgi:alkylated DNA nucleotide flippase Atl1
VSPDPSGSGAVLRAKFRPARGLVASARPERPAEAPRPNRSRAERLARQLALAHWIERAVEEGRASCYGEVARALGLSESRITQVTALLGLSPEVQERVLASEGELGIREAIRAAREVEWVTGSR